MSVIESLPPSSSASWPVLRLVHLYPQHLNMYGDRGNVLALMQRARWRGLPIGLLEVGLKPEKGPEPLEQFHQQGQAFHLVFMGGGQDAQQRAVQPDLLAHKAAWLKQAAGQGAVILGVCGGYQLMGHWYQPAQGPRLEGLGLLDVTTTAGQKRLIGNIALQYAGEALVSGAFPRQPETLVGFENHSGQTVLGPQAKPLGTVLKGFGNNTQPGQPAAEGAINEAGTCVGTYLHGSLLPKNPWLTDALLLKALQYALFLQGKPEVARGLESLPALLNGPDTLEKQAHQGVLSRLIKHG